MRKLNYVFDNKTAATKLQVHMKNINSGSSCWIFGRRM